MEPVRKAAPQPGSLASASSKNWDSSSGSAPTSGEGRAHIASRGCSTEDDGLGPWSLRARAT